jgi:hypothetical protein
MSDTRMKVSHGEQEVICTEVDDDRSHRCVIVCASIPESDCRRPRRLPFPPDSVSISYRKGSHRGSQRSRFSVDGGGQPIEKTLVLQRFLGCTQTALDPLGRSTDQKVGGSNPSERALFPLHSPGMQDITCVVAWDQLAAVRPPDDNRSQADWLASTGSGCWSMPPERAEKVQVRGGVDSSTQAHR